MLEKIIKRMNGSAAEPKVIEAELAQLATDREAARHAIEEIKSRRHQLLLDDAPDAAIDKVDRELDRGLVRLEKINAAEPGLRQRLEAALAERARERLGFHRAAVLKAYQALRPAITEAARLQAEILDLRKAAAAELGEQTAQTLIPNFIFGHRLFMPQSVAEWLAECDRIAAPAARPKAKAISLPKPAPKAETKPAGLQHAVRLDAPQPAPQRAERLTDEVRELGADEVRVRVLRAGYEAIDGRPSHQGRLVVLPRAIAEAAARNGAIEIIGPEVRVIDGGPNA